MYALTGREIDGMPTDVNGLLMHTDQDASRCAAVFHYKRRDAEKRRD
jgi:hypothetical protein